MGVFGWHCGVLIWVSGDWRRRVICIYTYMEYICWMDGLINLAEEERMEN